MVNQNDVGHDAPGVPSDSSPDDAVLFESSYEVTEVFFQRQYKSLRKVIPIPYWIAFAAKIIFGFFAVSSTLSLLLPPVIFSPILFLLCGFIWYVFIKSLIENRLNAKKQIRLFKKEWGESAWICTTRFTEAGIEYCEKNATVGYSYSHVRYVNESDEYYYLWIHGLGVADIHIAVDKTAFTVGDSRDFRAFIYRKALENQPMFTAKTHNLRSMKGSVFAIAILIAVSVYTTPGLVRSLSRALNPPEPLTVTEAVERQLSRRWDGTVRVIAVERLSGGAVIFAVNDADSFIVALFRESGRELYYSYGHSYSITRIDRYSRDFGDLFESDGLSFSGHTQQVFYGIADVKFWEGLPESERKRYGSRTFRHGSQDFVVYYRLEGGIV
jgi:hypothetical protein